MIFAEHLEDQGKQQSTDGTTTCKFYQAPWSTQQQYWLSFESEYAAFLKYSAVKDGLSEE